MNWMETAQLARMEYLMGQITETEYKEIIGQCFDMLLAENADVLVRLKNS